MQTNCSHKHIGKCKHECHFPYLRERERERERETHKERERHRDTERETERCACVCMCKYFCIIAMSKII